MSFKGTDNYVATDDLQLAVNAAVALEKPLLIKGEPGTGRCHALVGTMCISSCGPRLVGGRLLPARPAL